ncbi:hypothetical protein DPX16_12246 [Anabarilius grahami]|uniref:Uncharacterized protein n=1 Tax=Anabarilius grahami TaxID=495550 RepID=A0A3N0XFM3_ANAGA|nr:hypothetical protein DPX16_12246 [Anabarilius grahami]
MARAALIQSHCCRMNTSSERPEKVEKTEFGASKREIERVIEFPPCVWENKGKQGRVNMHEGKSNCVREGKRDNKRGEWTILNCRLRDFFPSRPLLFICYRTTPPFFHLSVCLYQGTSYESAHLKDSEVGISEVSAFVPNYCLVPSPLSDLMPVMDAQPHNNWPPFPLLSSEPEL